MPHTSYEALAKKLEDAKKSVTVGAEYRHYRNSESRYRVIAVALQEDGEKVCVVYQTSHPSGLIWVRNLDDWLAIVTNADGHSVSRFELIV